MIKFKPVKKILIEKEKKVSIEDSSRLLAEFFNGIVIEIEGECTYES